MTETGVVICQALFLLIDEHFSQSYLSLDTIHPLRIEDLRLINLRGIGELLLLVDQLGLKLLQGGPGVYCSDQCLIRRVDGSVQLHILIVLCHQEG